MLKFNDILDSNNFKTSMIIDLNYNKESINDNLNNNNLISNNYNNRIESSNTNLKLMNINKNNLNNINIININKGKNILVNKNEEEIKEKYLVSLLNHKREENLNNDKILLNKINNSNNKDVNKHFNRNNIYKLLVFQILHCFLKKIKKLEYERNLINWKIIQKKMDIYNYLILLKKFDLLLILFKKLSLQNNYRSTNSLDYYSNLDK